MATRVNPWDHVQVQGYTLNRRTKARLEEAERILKAKLTILQGSYNGGAGKVSASAGTHDGGGAVDVWCYTRDPLKVQAALRCCGFAAWFRPALTGYWGPHVHAECIGDRTASPSARAQWTSYENRTSGLVGEAPDNTWHPRQWRIDIHTARARARMIAEWRADEKAAARRLAVHRGR